MIKRLFDVVKFLVPLVIAYFIGREIYRNWQQVRQAGWEFDPGYLFISFLMTAGWFTLRPFVWGGILQRFGYPITYGASYRTFREAELSRYVPGVIWQYVGRVYLAGRWGVPAAATMAATLIETVLLVLASLLPALLNLQQALPELATFQRIFIFVVPIGALAIIHPRILNWWAGFLARRLKQPYQELKISWGAIAAIWAIYVLMWLVVGLGVGFFIRGVLPVPLVQVPLFGSYYAAAWFIAIISMIAPAGMGIRDGVFGLLLGQAMPIGTALTLAVGARLWLTLLELVWAGLGAWFFPGPQESEPSPGEAA